MRGITAVALGLLALPLLSGCVGSVKHNDVLIFGTDTKLALDVSANPAGGGTPEITIGYKRQEAVWMPLVVNGAGVTDKICAAANGGEKPCVGTLKYQGQAETGVEGKGGTDAYSVFASFGADIKGAAKAGGPEAAVGLAQFFATGIAAQRLAQNKQVVSALSLQGDQAGRVAEAAAGLSDEAVLLKAEALKLAKGDQSTSERYYACSLIKKPEVLAKQVKLLGEAESPENIRTVEQLSSVTSPGSVKRIIDKWNIRDQLEAAVAAACPAGG